MKNFLQKCFEETKSILTEIEKEIELSNNFNEISNLTFEVLRATWTTKAGKVLKPKEMDDSHLINVIRFIRENTKKLREIERTAILLSLPDDKPWADEICLEIGNDTRTDLEWLNENPIYLALLLEVKNRGLL